MAGIKFGTDGWRAVISEDFTFDNVKKVAQAMADYLNALPAAGEGAGRRFYPAAVRRHPASSHNPAADSLDSVFWCNDLSAAGTPQQFSGAWLYPFPDGGFVCHL